MEVQPSVGNMAVVISHEESVFSGPFTLQSVCHSLLNLQGERLAEGF